jgi:hypothetical protein
MGIYEYFFHQNDCSLDLNKILIIYLFLMILIEYLTNFYLIIIEMHMLQNSPAILVD